MACCQRGELIAPAVEEWIGADEQRVGSQLHQGLQRPHRYRDSVLAVRTWICCPDGRRSRLQRLCDWASVQSDCSGLTSTAISARLGNKLVQKSSRFGRQLGAA